MIDHVSITVRDLAAATRFYDALMVTLGQSRVVTRPASIGYGKKYPEFWLNERRDAAPVSPDTGAHVCFRAPSVEAVRAFYEAALAQGGRSDREPGPYPGVIGEYHAAFIRDPEGHRLEAATFLTPP